LRPLKGRKLVTATEGSSTSSKEEIEQFPRPVLSPAILPIHIVRVELQLNRLPDNSVHVTG
jgi:hypothetical protein